MFIIFLITVTLALISTAAYFSVFGIASLFAYNYIATMILGITLEAGKISVAIYLFRYWTLMSRLFRNLLLTFLVALMFITSVGIFGFLSQGYQKTSEEFNLISLELSNIESEYAAKKARVEVINSQVANLPSDSVVNKIRLSREFSDEQAEIRDRIAVIEPRVQELKVKRLAYESHIGPIAYVARMLHANQDSVVFFAILMLVFVADPLAITLTIACNMVVIRYWENARPRSVIQAAQSPMMFDHFLSEIKTAASDAYNSHLKKKEAKAAAALAKRIEADKKAELARKTEEAKQAEAAKKLEIARQAEAARLAKIAKEAEKKQKAEDAQKAKLAKEAEKIRKADEARQAQIAKKAAREEKAELARQAAIAKKAELAKKADEAKQAAAAKKIEITRQAEAARLIKAIKKTEVPKKPAPQKKAVPVKRSSPAKKTESAKKSSPLTNKTSTGKNVPAKKSAPVRKPSAPKKPAVRRKKNVTPVVNVKKSTPSKGKKR
jgi:hypothetical protein